MKKTIYVLLCIVFCLSLVACSAPANNNYYNYDDSSYDDFYDDSSYDDFYDDSSHNYGATTTYDNSIQYISDRSVQYNDANKNYTVFFGLKTINNEYVDSSGTAEIIIYDSETEKQLYSTSINFTADDFTYWSSNSWDSSRYLCGLYFDKKSLPHASSSMGILSLEVTLTDGGHFSEERMSIYELPTHDWESATCTSPKKCSSCNAKEGSALGHNYSSAGKCSRCDQMDPAISAALSKCSLSLPALPKTIHYRGYDNNIISTVTVTDITYEFEYNYNGYISLSVYFSGEKTYDKNGTGQSSECRIGWKLYDANNAVLDTGTFYSPSVAIGESFVNQEEILLYSSKKVGPGAFRLEILDVN